MTDRPNIPEDTLPVEALERVNRLCIEFEAALKDGRRPGIERSLARVAPHEQAVLFYELLVLELEYRRRLGSDVSPAEYCARFPEWGEAVGRAFAWLKTSGEAAMRTTTVRYCILCGTEIGGADFCTNPDCVRFPNLYRDVPGPGGERSENEGAAAPPEAKMAAAAKRAPEATARQTISVPPTPVAVLTGRPPLSSRHLIYPGVSEVGASRSSDVVVDRPEVSARHARLECTRGSMEWELVLTDHGSTNGTFVNGKRIRKARLRAGDRVRFARWEFELAALEDQNDRGGGGDGDDDSDGHDGRMTVRM